MLVVYHGWFFDVIQRVYKKNFQRFMYPTVGYTNDITSEYIHKYTYLYLYVKVVVSFLSLLC